MILSLVRIISKSRSELYHTSFWSFHFPSRFTVLISEHRVLGWESAGGLASRFFSIFQPTSICLGTVRQWRQFQVTGSCSFSPLVSCPPPAVQPLCDSRNSGAGTSNWISGVSIGVPEFQESHKQAIFPFQPSAFALMRLSATVDKIRLFPRPHATINDVETRDRGCGVLGGGAIVSWKPVRHHLRAWTGQS